MYVHINVYICSMKYKDKIKEKGLKINWVADRVGISRCLLSVYINEKRHIPLKIEDKLKIILK